MTRTFLRARRPEHKQQRREAILSAARELAAASGVRNVSLGAVAEAVGLAKSNVVRYFGTREEIYLVLACEEWQRWADAVTARLRTARDTADVAAALADTITDQPLFCDLLSHASTSLEHNVSVLAAREFKVTALRTAADGMLYPAANPPPTMAEVYAQNPELAAHCPQLRPSLVRALMALAAGLPTLR
jgi:AcrR family transcriptional regulator